MQILALHGFTGCGSDFAPLVQLGGEWHCPDLPGHGSSSQLDCSSEATIDFVQRKLSAFPNQKKILLGYSLGARAALLHATTHQDSWDGLILISPNPGIEEEAKRIERRATDARLAARIENDGVEKFLDFWQNTPMIRSQKNIRKDWLSKMQNARSSQTAIGLASSLRQFGQGECPDLWPKLGEQQIPILMITGDRDNKYSQIADRMESILPKAIHRSIPHVGHMPHLEAPELVFPIISSFIEAQSQAEVFGVG